MKAYIKYTKLGKLIPGGLMVRPNSTPPSDGIYKEVPIDLCCGIKLTTNSTMATFPVGAGGFGYTASCNFNSNGITININESPSNIQEMVAFLNEYASHIGTFSVNPDGINIDVRFAEGLTKLLSCPPGGIVNNTYNI